MVLAKDRNTPERLGATDRVFDVAAAVKIYGGALVVLDAAGNAKPGAAGADLITVGRAEEQVDNSAGAAGDKTVKVSTGVFRWKNSAGADEITAAHVGELAYVVDDETVALTDNAGARSPAGRIYDVDAQGVWVETGARRNLTAAASLDFPSVAAAGTQDLTIAVPGARVGEAVALGLPAAPNAGLTFDAWVSAADTVTVRASNFTAGAIDPAAATYRVTVVRP